MRALQSRDISNQQCAYSNAVACSHSHVINPDSKYPNRDKIPLIAVILQASAENPKINGLAHGRKLNGLSVLKGADCTAQ